jgi:hypothetical protein
VNLAYNCDFRGNCKDFLNGTDGFTSPPKEGALRIFRPKTPTASAGFEPANVGTRGQCANHQTTEAAIEEFGNYDHNGLDARCLVIECHCSGEEHGLIMFLKIYVTITR